LAFPLGIAEIGFPMIEFDTDVGGLRLRACQWGDRGNPVVLILHGWLDQAFSWAPIARSLSQIGYCVFAIDQRGHGLSEHAPRHSQYHFVDYVADVEAWLSANDIASIHLIGHSMGGTVSSLVAASLPERIASLLMIEGLGAPHDPPDVARARFLKHLRQRRRQARFTVFATREKAIERFRSHHPSLSPVRATALVNRILTVFEGGWAWTWDPRHKDKASESMLNIRYCQLLSEIKAPSAFILGESSPYTKLFSLEQRLESISTLQKRYSVSGGHNLHYEAPAELTARIVDWLETVS